MIVSGILWAGFLLLVVCSWLRSGRWPIFGPIFTCDLIRSARRLRLHSLRSAYLLAVLVTIGFAYYAHHPTSLFGNIHLSQREASEFGALLYSYFVYPQWGLILLGVPILTSDIIAEERQRKTLDFLLATPLAPMEILLGKLLSRTSSVMLFLLGGLPVVSFLYLLGGIDPNLVLFHFVAGMVTAFSLGSLGVYCSVRVGSSARAHLLTCALAVGWQFFTGACGCCGISSYTTLGNLFIVHSQLGANNLLWLLQDYALAHGVLSFLALWQSSRLLTRAQGPTRASCLATHQPLDQAKTPRKPRVRTPRAKPEFVYLKRLPPVTDHPIRWRELNLRSGSEFRLVVNGVVVGALFLIVFFMLLILLIHVNAHPVERMDPYKESLYLSLLWMSLFILCMVGLQIALQASQTIVSEKQRDTLEMLLTVPFTREELFREKFLTCLLLARTPWLALVALWGIATCVQSLHPLSFLVLVLGSALLGVWLASLGMWFSTTYSTVYRARLMFIIVFVMMHVLVPFLSLDYLHSPLYFLWQLYFLKYPLTSEFRFEPTDAKEVYKIGTFLSLIFYAGFALICFWLAQRRFRRILGYE